MSTEPRQADPVPFTGYQLPNTIYHLPSTKSAILKAVSSEEVGWNPIDDSGFGAAAKLRLVNQTFVNPRPRWATGGVQTHKRPPDTVDGSMTEAGRYQAPTSHQTGSRAGQGQKKTAYMRLRNSGMLQRWSPRAKVTRHPERQMQQSMLWCNLLNLSRLWYQHCNRKVYPRHTISRGRQ